MKIKIKNSLVLLLVFLFGIYFEKFEIKNKTNNFFSNIIEDSSRVIFSLFSNESLELFIPQEEFEKLANVRNKALVNQLLNEEINEWSKGKIIYNDQSRNIKIKLKGTFSDHWSDKNRWSFQIKINNDSKFFNGVERFNLQSPETSSFIYEWLLMKAFEKEKLIYLETKYYDLVVNGKIFGTYMFQDAISEEVLKKNNKKVGPIIGFTKENYIEEKKASIKLSSVNAVGSLNSIEDTFWRAKIEPVQYSDLINNKTDNSLEESIKLLESFRQLKKNTSETFDVNKLAKIMALRAALGSSEFDYRDIKFYFNPDTNFLEPISKEAHINLKFNYKEYYYSWWIDSSNIRPDKPSGKNFFLDTIYKDKKFYEQFLRELNNFTKYNYYENLINENYKDFVKYLKMQKNSYINEDIFSEDQLEINRLRIQEFLNPTYCLNIYFVEYKNDILKLNISNLHRLPVEVLGIEFKSGQKIILKNNYYIEGKIPQKPTLNQVYDFTCLNQNCNKDSAEEILVTYRILGQEKVYKEKISKEYYK